MYLKVKTVINSNVPLEDNPEENVNTNKLKGNRKSADACVFTSAGRYVEPIEAGVASAFTLDDGKVKEIPMLGMSKEIVNHSAPPAKHDIDHRFVTTKNRQLPYEKSVIVDEDEKLLISPSEYANLAKRLRLSKNPSVLELKVIAFVFPRTTTVYV